MLLLYPRFLLLVWVWASGNELVALRALPGSLERHTNTNVAIAMAALVPANNQQNKMKMKTKALTRRGVICH